MLYMINVLRGNTMEQARKYNLQAGFAGYRRPLEAKTPAAAMLEAFDIYMNDLVDPDAIEVKVTVNRRDGAKVLELVNGVVTFPEGYNVERLEELWEKRHMF